MGAGQGRRRGEQTGTGTAADDDTRREYQGQAAEAGYRQVRTTSRWAALRTGRGGGEQVKIERASKRYIYGWGGVRKEGGKERSRKRGKQFGADGID